MPHFDVQFTPSIVSDDDNTSTHFTRDRPIVRGRAALPVIDAQNATCGPKHKMENPEFYSAATGRVIPNIHRLLVSFRGARLEVIYTVIENLAEDGRDRSLDYTLPNIS